MTKSIEEEEKEKKNRVFVYIIFRFFELIFDYDMITFIVDEYQALVDAI